MFPRSKNPAGLLKWERELWFAWVACLAAGPAESWLSFVGARACLGSCRDGNAALLAGGCLPSRCPLGMSLGRFKTGCPCTPEG